MIGGRRRSEIAIAAAPSLTDSGAASSNAPQRTDKRAKTFERSRGSGGDIARPEARIGRGGRRLDVGQLPDHREKLLRGAYALCRSREDAEDLVQETYARVLRRPRVLHRDDSLGYLLRVMRNLWIDTHRERTIRLDTVEFDDASEFMADRGADPTVSVAELQTVYAAVSQLNPALRETLVAVDVVGLSYRQAAKALLVPQGTIMSRLFRARNEVARRSEEAWGARPQRLT
jgi:RNA polymerase sigma-70 factor, ECF subfamily